MHHIYTHVFSLHFGFSWNLGTLELWDLWDLWKLGLVLLCMGRRVRVYVSCVSCVYMFLCCCEPLGVYGFPVATGTGLGWAGMGGVCVGCMCVFLSCACPILSYFDCSHLLLQ